MIFLSEPLLPRHKIRLIVCNYEHEGDHERFVRIFRETWRALPLRVRRTLLKYWRGCSVPSPHLELCDHKSEIDEQLFDALAVCSLGGHMIAFWSPAMDILPDEQVKLTIAHELAHAYLWAKGDPSHTMRDRKRDWFDLGPEEMVNELLVEDWWMFFEEDLARGPETLERLDALAKEYRASAEREEHDECGTAAEGKDR